MNKLHRRNFLKQSGLAAAGLLTLRLPTWASQPYQGVLQPVHNIPADKALDPKWVRSLYERGLPGLYTKAKNELRYIGMPAGGLHSGTVPRRRRAPLVMADLQRSPRRRGP